ncbi:MAG: PQQ-binding-like beta-propeller repeat protein [Fimbriimonadaceae bacterium]|nr:PQQ-binding-like beta-propeller repeat protein [Fimbriimonadaceae bacterium]
MIRAAAGRGRWLPLLAALLTLRGLPAATAAVQVWFDENGDGARQADEPGAPQVLVSDGDRLLRTDQDGRVTFEPSRAAGETCRVWVLLPGGHRATTAWSVLLDPQRAAPQTAAFGLQPVNSRPDTPVAVTSDPQVSAGEAARVAGELLAELAPPAARPAAIVLLGDVAERGERAAVEAWQAALAGAPVPVYQLFGAHDGETPEGVSIRPFEELVGPAWYAFWTGGRLWIALTSEPEVLSGLQQARQLRWLRRLLAGLPAGTETVLLGHVPPAESEVQAVAARTRLRAVLYGHWHENAVWYDGDVPLICTGPFRGVEWGAGTASWRRVQFLPTGLEAPVVTSGVRRLLRVLAPSPLEPPERLGLGVRVLAYDSTLPVTAVAAWVGQQPVSLRRAGRFTWRADLPAGEVSQLQVVARNVLGERWETAVAVPLAARRPVVDLAASAPPPQPPLVRVWLTSTGAPRLTNAAPTVAGDRLLLALPGDDQPSEPAVGCFDLSDGRLLWRAPTAGNVRREVLCDGRRVYALGGRQVVHCLALETGQELWRRDLTPNSAERHRNAHTGLALWRDRVLALAAGGALFQLQASDGTVLETTPLLQLLGGAPTVVGNTALVATAGGVTAVDLTTGSYRWQTALRLPRRGGLSAGEGLAFVQGPELTALDLLSGAIRWQQPLPTVGLNLGAPLLHDGVVYSAGARPLAYRETTGVPLWNDLTPLTETSAAGVASAGSLVWAVGDDGTLVAYDRNSGAARWRAELGLPLKAPPVVVGNLLVAVDLDGNLHGLVSAAP